MGINSGRAHDVDNDAGDVAGLAVRGVQNPRPSPRKKYILLVDTCLPYADVVLSDCLLTAVSATATLDYFKEGIVKVTRPISVFTHTLRNILYARHNNTTKAQVLTIVEDAETSKPSHLFM